MSEWLGRVDLILTADLYQFLDGDNGRSFLEVVLTVKIVDWRDIILKGL